MQHWTAVYIKNGEYCCHTVKANNFDEAEMQLEAILTPWRILWLVETADHHIAITEYETELEHCSFLS